MTHNTRHMGGQETYIDVSSASQRQEDVFISRASCMFTQNICKNKKGPSLEVIQAHQLDSCGPSLRAACISLRKKLNYQRIALTGETSPCEALENASA